MGKLMVFIILFAFYVLFSAWVYTQGTESKLLGDSGIAGVKKGKQLFEQYNCVSCHQLYGLGGYLGPELTTAWSDKRRGEAYLRAMLQGGGQRMPNFGFDRQQIDDLLSYLRYVDSTAITYKTR